MAATAKLPPQDTTTPQEVDHPEAVGAPVAATSGTTDTPPQDEVEPEPLGPGKSSLINHIFRKLNHNIKLLKINL